MKKRFVIFAVVILIITAFEFVCYLLTASDTFLNVIGFLIVLAAIVFGISIEFEYKKEFKNEDD